jgi:rhodanese-related sulfurtransferase
VPRSPSRPARLPALLLGVASLAACHDPAPPAVERAAPALPTCVPGTEAPSFARAPSGAREVSAAWLAAHRCEVHLVDVRSREERESTGQIEGAEWVPLAALQDRAADWPSERPVVLLDRSGRRATPGARTLEALGIRDVASLTGGMLAWLAEGWPVVPVAPEDVASAPPSRPDASDPVRALLSDPDRLTWVSVASMIGAGSEHCIDGRAGGPVVGTPGGDAGELTLALAAIERTAHAEVDERSVAVSIANYAASFGRFYLHTDAAALERLDRALAADPRWAAHRGSQPIAALVARPPAELEETLVALLAQPEYVGCGHLRLLLEHPEEYGVRRELAETVLRETHRLRYRQPELVDFEVLEGEHEERAIVQVLLDHPVHAYSRVPTLPHREGDAVTFFVSHPEVSAFLRAELGSFLLEDVSALGLPARARRRLTGPALDHELAALAERQILATLRHLARELPVYEMHLRSTDGGEPVPTVSGPNATLGCRSY